VITNLSNSQSSALWNFVGVVFIAEYVLPPIGRALKGAWTWARDLSDLREELYEPADEEEESDEDEEVAGDEG
jgi:hypothetical protein